MVPLRFLRALFCVDGGFRELRGSAAEERGCPTDVARSAAFATAHPALFRASGFAAHPYPQGTPPNFRAPDEPDYGDLASLPQLERTLDRLQAVYASSVRFPIYSTEFGYITDPPSHVMRGATPALTASYLNWAEYISWRDERVRSYDQYLLADASGSLFASGLEFADGRPKAGFYAYRLPIFLPVTRTLAGRDLEVWGCVRPALFARRQHQVARLEFRPPHGAFETIEQVPLSDPNGYFDIRVGFPSSGLVRLAWTYPHGQTIYSRTVNVTLS
jgi:hypothetical protein